MTQPTIEIPLRHKREGNQCHRCVMRYIQRFRCTLKTATTKNAGKSARLPSERSTLSILKNCNFFFKLIFRHQKCNAAFLCGDD